MPSSKARQIKPAKEGHEQTEKASPPGPRKRQSTARISAACEACKKRKTKCTGGPPPCQLCQSLGTECVIDLTLDMRRRAALQRTVDESKSYQDALNRLIDCIREGSSPQYESLLEYVRGGASNQDVIDAVHNSPTLLEDDSENTSPLQNHIKESQSPLDNAMTDNNNLLQNQPSGGLPTVDEDKHMSDAGITNGESSSPSGLSREKSFAQDISTLISKLKILPATDGEQLLGQILAEYSSGKQYDVGYSAAQHSHDGFSRDAVVPSTGERSMWHPALHVRSQPAESEESRQVRTNGIRLTQQVPTGAMNVFMNYQAESGPFQRRYTDLAVSISNSASSSSTEPSATKTSPSYPTSRHSRSTDPQSLSGSLQSPTSLYVESTNLPPSKQRAGNASDLSIAQDNMMVQLRIPIHLVLPLIIPDDSYLSNMYTDYVEGAKQMLKSGTSFTDVLGDNDEVSLELFFRSRTGNDKFDCASWACEVCRALPILDDYVRMASAYMLTLMMRWLLSPTQAAYAKIPDMMKPTPSQRMIPHIGAIEILPLGPLRDALIHHMRDWLSQLKSTNWSVNWPHDLNAAIAHDPVTNTRKLTPKFIEHVLEYDNWSVSRDFLNAFPELTGRIRVHE
ncbi:hypothetical protein LTR84_002095 [Exophiala bonariae]|uniref:Zn(2)-C6 fungal-type domain-containing protein n=1 Tax=Exophiala bonariae TaxID=1690606 RepID=A0AAV9NBL4_9EURO|nr:hypothetical protein LTR84_002095 [Exophiala bonariae]